MFLIFRDFRSEMKSLHTSFTFEEPATCTDVLVASDGYLVGRHNIMSIRHYEVLLTPHAIRHVNNLNFIHNPKPESSFQLPYLSTFKPGNQKTAPPERGYMRQ